MKLSEAKDQVLALIDHDIESKQINLSIEPHYSKKDVGKMVMNDKTARIIAPFDGFFANINLSWFDGSNDLPKIKGEEFYWYIFALVGKVSNKIAHYFICDFHRMKEWVLEFNSPSGNDHRDHHDWRGAIEIINEREGYFRWGDEPMGARFDSRRITLNNISEIAGRRQHYLPSRSDFIYAYNMLTELDQEIPIDRIIDQIEINMKSTGRILEDDWRARIEKNIFEKW